MIINFNNLKDEDVKEKISKIFSIAREVTNTKNNISVNITIVSQKEIQRLNNEFRGIDRVTDVLSFPLFEKDELKTGEMLDENITSDIGDIVICKVRAKEQAKEYGHSLLRELCFLSLHGFLHLLGYDHIEKKDEEIMFPLQEKILKEADIQRWVINSVI